MSASAAAAALLLGLAAPRALAAGAEAPGPKSGRLEDVVIKAREDDEPSSEKPPFDVRFDPYESVRSALKPDESLLLLDSPGLADWSRSRPERLKDERLIQPWNDVLVEFEEIPLPARDALAQAAGKASPWSLTVVDEEGKPFRRFDGKGPPPERLSWDGLSEQGDWLRAGHAYSPVYKFFESSATARTVLGQPIRFAGLARKDAKGRVIGLDSSVLFGVDRRGKEVSEEGKTLLRAAADWIRRRAFGDPLLLSVHGPDADAARAQAESARTFLAAELGMPADRVSAASAAAAPSDQRVELLVEGSRAGR